MARMIPDSPPPRLARPVARVWRSLRKIQSDELVCRISYALDGEQRPEFMVTYEGRYVFLLAVSSAGDEELEAMLQAELFGGQDLAEQLSLKERHAMESFVASLLEVSEAASATEPQAQKWLLFPYASASSVARLAEVANWPDYSLFGREDCSSERLAGNFDAHSHSPLGELLLETLQGRFSPEATIPARWVAPRENPMSVLEPRQTDYLLDLDQEAVLKRDLELSDEAHGAAGTSSLRLVTGVAGCGKTLVLLLRARMTAMLQPGARVLVLMHNRALRADLAARAREMDEEIAVEWETFMSWIRRFLSFSVPPPWELRQLIESLKTTRHPGTELSLRFLEEEFAWIADHA
ncbi:MAG: hypothetical protein ACOC3I_10470, partial [Verrucomicrobiota bacterium]